MNSSGSAGCGSGKLWASEGRERLSDDVGYLGNEQRGETRADLPQDLEADRVWALEAFTGRVGALVGHGRRCAGGGDGPTGAATAERSTRQPGFA